MPMTSSNQVSHLANAPSKAPFVPEYIPGNDCNDNKNHVDNDHDDDNVQIDLWLKLYSTKGMIID